MFKLLIVDDEKLLRQGFIHMTDWSDHGYEIVGEAGNGEDALRLIDTLRPDIVVTDIKMPGMDGIGLIQAIKSDYPKTEVIVLSSYSDFPYVKDSLQLGAADYILKASMSFEEVLLSLGKVTGKLSVNEKNEAYEKIRNKHTVSQYFHESNETAPNQGTFYDPLNNQTGESLIYDAEEKLISIGSWNWKEIRPYMESGTLEELYTRIWNSVIQLIEKGQQLDPYLLQKGLVELIYMIIHKLDEEGWGPGDLQKNKIAYFRNIESATNFHDCMKAFKDALSAVSNHVSISGYSIHAYSPTIRAVANYLQQHFANPELSLSEAAQRFHLNKSYLSQLFKQQTGTNFQAYLTEVRINKAKELLRKSVPVNEVCHAIGIDNVSYFSQLFKRSVGTTPSEYARTYIEYE